MIFHDHLRAMAFSGHISWQQKQVIHLSAFTCGRLTFMERAKRDSDQCRYRNLCIAEDPPVAARPFDCESSSARPRCERSRPLPTAEV